MRDGGGSPSVNEKKIKKKNKFNDNKKNNNWNQFKGMESGGEKNERGSI